MEMNPSTSNEFYVSCVSIKGSLETFTRFVSIDTLRTGKQVFWQIVRWLLIVTAY